MNRVQERSNPYVIGSPVIDSHDFIGRDQFFDSLNSDLNVGVPLEPMILEGPKGIGKTSFLKQIEVGRIKSEIVPIYVDIHHLPIDEMTEFLWALAKLTMNGLGAQGVAFPALEKRLLILRPWQAFNRYFWRHLPGSADGKLILFTFDNFDELVTAKADQVLQQGYRQRLFTLFEGSDSLAILLSLAGRTEAFSPDSLRPFHLANSYRLPRFSRVETNELVRRPGRMVVFDEVIDFIYKITKGHPGDVQQLCHALYERYVARGLRQLTMVDVVATLEMDLRPREFRTAVYRRLADVTVWKPPTSPLN